MTNIEELNVFSLADRNLDSNVSCVNVTKVKASFCRSAFFHGQIEVPRRGAMLWLPRPDLPVLVSINGAGVTVVDPSHSVSIENTLFFESNVTRAKVGSKRRFLNGLFKKTVGLTVVDASYSVHIGNLMIRQIFYHS